MSTRYRRVAGAEFRAWWQARYATDPGTLDGCSFWRRGRWNLWVASGEVDPGAIRPVEGVGIPFLRLSSRIWKPTGVAAVHFGATARRHVVDLCEEEARGFLRRQDVELGGERRPLDDRGWVIVRWRGLALGVAERRAERLVSLVAKGKVRETLDVPRSGGRDG